MGIVADISQDQKIAMLERKLRRLSRSVDGRKNEMKLFKEIIGQECVINGEGLYNEKCRILDTDDEWVKITVHGKKSEVIMIVRIDNIESVTLVNE